MQQLKERMIEEARKEINQQQSPKGAKLFFEYRNE
jgi:hypothetical protein